MLIINRSEAIKLILLFALINSSIFIGFAPSGISLERIVIVFFLLNSVALLFIFSLFKKDVVDTYIHPYFKIVLALLFLWSSFTIIRSLSFQSKDLISLFGHYLMAWAWITPLAITFGLNIKNWLQIFNFLAKLLLVGIFLTLLLLPLLNYTSIGFGIVEWLQFFPIVLLTYLYQKSMNKKIAFFALCAFVLISIVNSQRVSIVFVSMTLFFFMLEYFRDKNISSIKKIFLFTFLTLILVSILIKFSSLYLEVSHDKELTTDTRTFLVVELFNDMSEKDLFIGRGALGTYYSPYFAALRHAGIHGGDSPIRAVSEIGYLEMVLKGGYIMVLLYLFILIPAAYLALFRSKNQISRVAGYVIIMYLVIWTISYYPVYSDEYLLLWMLVGTAISPRARNITDEELKLIMEKKFET